jgi:cytochrome c556
MLKKALVAAVACAAIALPAVADQAAVDARKAQFTLFAFNLSVLGGMAQGARDYDAAAAQLAADNLFHLTRHDQSRLWPEGSDNMAMDGTRALPAIWDNLEDFAAKFAALQSGAEAMQAVAGTGLDAMRGAMGGIAGACQACHQANRAP